MSWGLGSLIVLMVALTAGFAWYERSHPSAKVLALVATLSALAAIGRIAFAPLPNVKPTTDIVLAAGYALGGAPGFAVGALAALTSNVFFGQGPWTPWQMAAWGAIGIGGAVLARATRGRIRRLPLAIACALAGLAYGVVLNLSTWVTFTGDHTLGSFLAIAGSALPFDLAHAAGNFAFALAFGPALIRAVQRFRARFEIRWRPAPASVATLAVVALALVVAVPGALAASSATYLKRAQNPDGGFGAAPGESSSQLYAGWTALGLAAAGRNPLDVRRAGHSIVDFIRANASQLGDTGELERTILVLSAAGVSPRHFAGRDLVAELKRRRRPNGSVGGQVNLTAFGLMALRAAGERGGVLRPAARWLAAQQGSDGGFNFFARGGASGIDDSAAAIEGLVAGGARGSGAVRRAVRFLERRQSADGGFALQPGGASNAQSTAFAIQALIAAGRDPDRLHHRGSRSPLGYLRTLTTSDGSVRYSRTMVQTPVWVTAQALAALKRRPLPIGRVPRSGGAASAVAGRAGTTGARAGRTKHRAARGAAAPGPAHLAPDLVAGASGVGVLTAWLLAPIS